MSDEKPLRPEDYRALAEEARRLKAENERLKARKPFPWRKFFYISGTLSAITIALCLIAAIPWACGEYERAHPSPPVNKNPPDCTWSMQYGLHDLPPLPWYKWHVASKDYYCMECLGTQTCDNSDCGFATYEDAEAFIKHWNLPRCK